MCYVEPAGIQQQLLHTRRRTIVSAVAATAVAARISLHDDEAAARAGRARIVQCTRLYLQLYIHTAVYGTLDADVALDDARR